ncbi:MAG TPA: hypothetical protein DCX14_14860 [Flavobacteriales bacterium]|jgi:hypothetical protein|nr:T9SS type A sorting domain-containing protein [Flavobacteriales bacterium]HAW21460.1 hypothetical protein [Flavobacteriales bacterium]
MHFLLTAFIFGCSFSLFAQDSILQSFSLNQSSNGVQILWTIKEGNTCQGINILRSTDSLNFSEIGDIQGVCGSIDQSESYTFLDQEPPKNQRIFYRLELGFNGLSRIIHIDYYSIEGDFLLFPNPTSNKVNLIRSNPSRQQLKIKVFTFQGEHMFDMQTPRETVQIDVSTWPSGTYLITIHNQDALMEKVQYANFIVTNN